MKKIAVVIAILLAVLVSGCAKKTPDPRMVKYQEKDRRIEEEKRRLEEKVKPPTTVEEAYNTTQYNWDEYSKTEITKGNKIRLPAQKNSEDMDTVDTVHLYLEKINKDHYLIIKVGSWCDDWEGCFPKEAFIKAIDKNAGALTPKSIELDGQTWSITDKQIKTMSTYGSDLRLYIPPFPTRGYIDVHVPAVYVQGFLKRVNEYRKYKE